VQRTTILPVSRRIPLPARSLERAFASTLKWLALALFAYVITAFRVGVDWRAVAHSALVPSWPQSSEAWATLVAILGTTISPYLFYWQASQEVEEEKALGRRTLANRRGATGREITDRTVDVGVGTDLDCGRCRTGLREDQSPEGSLLVRYRQWAVGPVSPHRSSPRCFEPHTDGSTAEFCSRPGGGRRCGPSHVRGRDRYVRLLRGTTAKRTSDSPAGQLAESF